MEDLPARLQSGPSTLTHLEGGLSGRRYGADRLTGLDPSDQRPLLARYDLAAAAATLSRQEIASRRSGGLWRWRELLPVRDEAFITYLGEGDTPLQPVSWPGLPRLMVKRESLNPTGSFKARGMAVAVSRAAELGARHLVTPSAGNAGGALAAYAAAAGLRATVIMPADAPAINQVEVLAAGARLILLEGLISDCGRLAGVIRDEVGAFDLSTLKEPYRVEGKKTMGFEVAEQLAWRLPDAIVYPTGGGTGIVGMWKAFDELEAVGLIGRERPRMFSVQAEGCAPIVRAFDAGERFARPWDARRPQRPDCACRQRSATFSSSTRCGSRAAPRSRSVSGRFSSGARAWRALSLGYASLETSAAAAGLDALLEAGAIDKDERVVLFDTGAGFKSESPSVDAPEPVPNDPDFWTENVIPGLGP